MKKSQTLLLAAVLLPVFFISALWFQSYRLLPSSQLHEALSQKIQALTEGTLKYQGVRIGYFPQPKIVFERPQLTLSEHSLTVDAEKIQFDFNILPLFLGRAEPAAFYVQSGKAEFSLPGLTFLNPVRFENFFLQVGAVREKIPIPFHFVSDLAGKPAALVIKGNVVLDSVEQWDWKKASGSMVLEVKQLLLDSGAVGITKGPGQVLFFKGGQIDTSVEIKKKAQEAFLELIATGTGTGLTYELPQEKTWAAPPPINVDWTAAAAWNQDSSELKLHKAKVKLPFGEIEANGSAELNTGEIAGVHVTGSDMALEDILKYWPGLENAIPFHIGFSGPGKWVLSMEGTVDHLSLHFDWDLAQVLLSYGQYFTKPKNIPLDLNFDLLLQKGATLGGDFAVKFKEMSLKGNLKDLDLKTGAGQLNLITNKFSVAGWEEYIQKLQRYKLAGDAKLMANWKGDLRQLEKAERIFNITFDKASLTVPEGRGIRNASLSLDYSPLMMEGRQMQFEIGESPVVMDLKVSGFPDSLRSDAKISSVEMKPLEVCHAVGALFQRKAEGGEADIYDHLKNSIQMFFPAGQILKNVSAEVHYDGKIWDVSTLQFEGYGGTAALIGTWSFKDKEPQYHWEGGFQGVDLGLFLSRQDAAQKVLEGKLDLKGSIDGAGWWMPETLDRTLKGKGMWTLASGRFLTFDPKDAVAMIEPFAGLGIVAPDLRDFEMMNFDWQISEGKVTTGNLLVKAKDYVLDGEGTLGFDGLANFRMDVFLSNSLAAALLPEMANPFEKNAQAHLGPVPMLLSGILTAPEVKPDPVQVGELTQKIREGKAKDVMVELVLE